MGEFCTAQDIGIEYFLSLTEAYNETPAMSENEKDSRMPQGWESEYRFCGKNGEILVDVWTLGKKGNLCVGRLLAQRIDSHNYSLRMWLYDEKMADKFVQSLQRVGYTAVSSSENAFVTTTLYQGNVYMRCVKIMKVRNTGRYNAPEWIYEMSLADSYCNDQENSFKCESYDYEDGAAKHCSYGLEGGRIVGEYVVSDSVGNILERVNYITGQREGEGLRYYKNGKIRQRSNYKNDLLNGPQTDYDERGNVLKQQIWDMGWITRKSQDKDNGEIIIKSFLYYNRLHQSKDSIIRVFKSSGELLSEESYCFRYDGLPGFYSLKLYVDTTRLGFSENASITPLERHYPESFNWMYYVSDSTVIDTVSKLIEKVMENVNDSAMRDSLRNGWSTVYHYDKNGNPSEREIRSYILGRLECYRHYVGGKTPMPLHLSASFRNHACVVQDGKGTLLCKGGVKGDRRDGKWQYFTDTKKKKVWKEEYYSCGELDGVCKQTLQKDSVSGKWMPMSLTAHYKLGRLDGEYERLDSTKTVLMKGNYVKGNKEGPWTEVQYDGSVWQMNYHLGARHGKQQLYSSKGLLDRILVYETGELRDLTVLSGDGGDIVRYEVEHNGKDYQCRITQTLGDTVWIKTWRLEGFGDLQQIEQNVFDEWIEKQYREHPRQVYSDGERLVYKKEDKNVVYAHGNLLKDRHVGDWVFVDYDQEVRLNVTYDNSGSDIIMRERYTDFNGNPYSGTYYYPGGYENTNGDPKKRETRDVENGARVGGFGYKKSVK